MNTDEYDDVPSLQEIQELGFKIGMSISKEIVKGIFNKLTKPVVTIIALNEDNKPVKDVSVIIGNRQEITATSGKAIFESMSAGKFNVSVKYKGIEELNVDVIFLENGERVTVTITLEQDKFLDGKQKDITLINEEKNLKSSSIRSIDSMNIESILHSPKLPIKETVKEVIYKGYLIREIETGSIEVSLNGEPIVPAKPILREIAIELKIDLYNSNGNHLTTRQLGSQIIKNIQKNSAK